MGNVILIIMVWLTAIICYPIMKKIQPESAMLYLVYVLTICILVTVVGAIHLS